MWGKKLLNIWMSLIFLHDGHHIIIIIIIWGKSSSLGTWAIVQAKNSTIDFDYLAYTRLRYEGYRLHKEQFWSS